MKVVNNIAIRVFAPPEENQNAIKETFLKLLNLSEEDIKKEKVQFEEKTAKGFSERKIKTLTCLLEKDRHCNPFLKKLVKHLSKEDKDLLIHQKNRLDEHYDFFIRLDKDELLKGKYVVTQEGNCFHIRMNIATFPRNEEKARAAIQEIFS